MDKEFKETLPNIIVGSGFNDAMLGLGYFSLSGRLMHANPALQKIFGYDTQSMLNIHYSEVTHPEDVNKLETLLDDFREGKVLSKSFDIRCFNAQGKTLYLQTLFSIMHDQYERPTYLIAVIQDLTSEHTAIEETRLNRQFFETVAEYSPTTVWLASPSFDKLLFVNDAFCKIWGIERKNIENMDKQFMLNRVHPDDRERVLERFNSISSNPDQFEQWSHEFRIMHANGNISHIEDRGRVVRDENGKPRYMLGTHHDVTDKVIYTEKLELLNSELQKAYNKVKRLSEYDSLTNCLNRAAMTNRLSDALYQFNRYEIPSTLIYLDLNGFKQINDKYGHYVGDQVLIRFVEKLQGLIRQTDILGRMGGDEFLLLFPGANQLSAEQFLVKSKKHFDTRVEIPHRDSVNISMHYSAGIAEIDFAVNNTDEWIDIADRAMYMDKVSSQ